MILNPINLSHYLIDKKYIEESDIQFGYHISVDNSRNKNFLIRRSKKDGILVKQVRQFDQGKIFSLKTEATIYWIAFNEKGCDEWRDSLVSFIGFDDAYSILAIGLEDRSINLFDYLLDLRNMDVKVPLEQARILNSYHSLSFILKHKSIESVLHQRLPWIFNLADASPEELFLISKADFEIYHQVRSSVQLVNAIRMAKDYWKVNGLIHGDIKMPNFIVANPFKLKLIDWEMAQLGDTLWDAAAIIHDYLIQSINIESSGQKNTPLSINPAKMALTFWKEYTKTWDEVSLKLILPKVSTYAGLRLIQSVIEQSHFHETMTSKTRRTLNLSCQLILEPEAILTRFFKSAHA